VDAGHLRVSDAEREEAVDRLARHAAAGRLSTDELETRSAAALVATTANDLAALEADLPAESPAPATTPARVETRATPTEFSAVLGTTKQTGPWRVAGPLRSRAVLGDCVVDLRAAELPGGPIELRARTFLGEITVLVPEGTTVELTGKTIMGERTVDVPGAGTTGGTVLRLDATAILGSVKVTTETKHERNVRRLREARKMLGR
jgi:uncharacterized protein DUF1707/cell wall-active antibiotic response 4TMS protein YvqF